MKRTFIAFLLFFTISTELFSQGNWQTIPFTPSSIRYDDMNFSNDSTGYISQFSDVVIPYTYSNQDYSYKNAKI